MAANSLKATLPSLQGTKVAHPNNWKWRPKNFSAFRAEWSPLRASISGASMLRSISRLTPGKLPTALKC